MTSFNSHTPVLLKEVIHAFSFTDMHSHVVVDGTLGGAGHSMALLQHYPHLKILACDIDLTSIDAARERLIKYIDQDRIHLFHGNFNDLLTQTFQDKNLNPPWSGVLLDLGYSSNQLENPEYGLSFLIDGPLDMRLSKQSQTTAWDLLIHSSEEELGKILALYGEISGAYKIARWIHVAIQKKEIKNSSKSLAQFLDKRLPRIRRDNLHPATLVFQALRIAVNDELRNLDRFLEGVTMKVRTSGRVAVITFHSLEDRIVKQWGVKHKLEFKPLTQKPLMATPQEVEQNPRSRSAKLRVYERGL